MHLVLIAESLTQFALLGLLVFQVEGAGPFDEVGLVGAAGLSTRVQRIKVNLRGRRRTVRLFGRLLVLYSSENARFLNIKVFRAVKFLTIFLLGVIII